MNKPFLTCYGLWCSLGIYRGAQDFNKKYNKDYKFYLENPKSKKPEYYYIDYISSSFSGFLCYANPIILPFFVFVELKDLERKVRGIKDEKEKD
jgi:hypothetical protein